MAPIITDPKKLSMPQQVQKNKDDIAEIKEVIDGLDSLDNVIIVPDISHIMTAEELKSVKQPVCFIVYDNHIYIKKKEESGNAYFDIVFSIIATTVISFQSSEIEVNLSNGALGIVNSTVSTYSSTKIDQLLALLPTFTYIDTELAKKANLSGATFTGAITSPSIIEIMSGYSFIAGTMPAGITMTLTYAGVCKNGNKITFVLAGKATRTGNVTDNIEPGFFRVPQEILSKLYNTVIGGISALDFGIVYFYKSYSQGVNVPVLTFKSSDSVYQRVYGVNFYLDLDTEYGFRYEKTFLLSDNLIP